MKAKANTIIKNKLNNVCASNDHLTMRTGRKIHHLYRRLRKKHFSFSFSFFIIIIYIILYMHAQRGSRLAYSVYHPNK